MILAVKPQKMKRRSTEIRGVIRADALVVSIAAGVTIDELAADSPRVSALSA